MLSQRGGKQTRRKPATLPKYRIKTPFERRRILLIHCSCCRLVKQGGLGELKALRGARAGRTKPALISLKLTARNGQGLCP